MKWQTKNSTSANSTPRASGNINLKLSPTIKIEENDACVVQSSPYYENFKIALTEPLKTNNAEAVFKIDNLKYCVGVGIAFKEVIEKHEYTYKCNFLFTSANAN